MMNTASPQWGSTILLQILSKRLPSSFLVVVCAGVSLFATPDASRGDEDGELATVRAVAERLEGARERIEAASYRVVLNQEFMKEWRDRVGVEATNNQVTMDIVEKGPLRRVTMHMVVRYEGDRPDYEATRRAVINDEGIAIWRGEPSRRIDIHEHESIDTASIRVREQFRMMGGEDHLRFGFGVGRSIDLGDVLRRLPSPDHWRVREVGPREASVIEIRWYVDDERRILAALAIADPQRGGLITRMTQYHPADGQALVHYEVDPMLVEDHHGEAIWFPGMVRQERWHRDDEGRPYLGSHRIYRFEGVELNGPVANEDFSFVNAMKLGEKRFNIVLHRLDGRGEYLEYEDGELIPTDTYLVRRGPDGELTTEPVD